MAERPATPRLHRVPETLPPVALWPRRLIGFPAALPPLIGRKREIAELCDLLPHPEQRLVTLTGPGGVGKTRLAIAAAIDIAAEFKDGAVFVPLAAISDPSLVLPAVAHALEVNETPGKPLSETLADALRDRRLLVVLDNLEHVLTSTRDLMELLILCPRLTLLVTSRAPLRLGVEQRFATPPLALPSPGDTPTVAALAELGAIALFVARARAVRHEFALDAENAAAVSDICRRLDGLPLAIELAAGWVRVLSPSALLERLEQRLPLLHGGAADQPGRLRTMRDAIAWSYDLLSNDEARLFRRLSVFVGGFTLEAVEWVTGVGSQVPGIGTDARRPTFDALDLLAGLVDKCLVQLAQASGKEPRFTMLETIREFALERLEASGEEPAIAAAHAASVMDLAESAEPHLLGPEERTWQNRVDDDLGNVRAAITWALEHDVETALRIAGPLWVYWSVEHLAEGRRWVSEALARPSPAPDRARARAMTTQAALANLLGDFAAGEAMASAAAALAEQTGDRLWEARARWNIGVSQSSVGSIEHGAPELDRSLALFSDATTTSDRALAAFAGLTRGTVALMTGDVEHGIGTTDRALMMVRESGSDAVSIHILSDFAGWLIALGNTARARLLLQEARLLVERVPISAPTLVFLLSLAMLSAVEGAIESATELLGAIEAIRARLGFGVSAHFQARLDQTTVSAKKALGDEGYSAAWTAGVDDPEGTIAAAMSALGATACAPISGKAATAAGLSPREREVLALLAGGHSDREIADALFISYRTATHHVSAILAKLDARTRAEAAVRAVRAGLI